MQTNQSNQRNQPRRPKLVRLLALAAALAALPASATTWQVTSTSDASTFGTLRYAISNAASGDTIEFNLTTPATIALTNGTLYVRTDVAIVGPGPDNLTVDAQQHEAFYIAPSNTVSISGLTITNGLNYAGGAIWNEQGAALSLTNCVFANNSASDGGGGAIANFLGTLNLDNCLLINNNTQTNDYFVAFGGAIWNVAGTLTLDNCTLANNDSLDVAEAFLFGMGGAIFNDAGLWLGVSNSPPATATLDNCLLSNNVAGGGGAIFNDTSGLPGIFLNVNGETNQLNGIATLAVTNCTFSDNTNLFFGGGAIVNEAGPGTATVTIADSAFSGNSISTNNLYYSYIFVGGGALDNDSGYLNYLFHLGFGGNFDTNAGTATMNITRSTFSNNTGFYGGALANESFGSNTADTAEVTISQSLVSSNTAFLAGGIVNLNFDNLGGVTNLSTTSMAIANSTVSGNTTFFNGFIGGIVNAYGPLVLDNVTVSGNSGVGIYNIDGALGIKNTILDTGSQGTNIYNADTNGTIISYGYNLSSDDGSGYLTGPNDLTNTDPLLGPLQDNGGPTLTQALLPGSPAIDAGSPTDIAGDPVTVDQRGYPRPGGSGNDIGAYEVQGVPFASFDASKLRIWLGPPSSFELQSYFTLGTNSDGINPTNEVVTLQIGTMTLTLPAGSFQVNHPGDDVFSGIVDGVSLNAKFHYEGGSDWQFKANATNANLLGTTNPVTVTLTIGNDSGTWTGDVPIN